MTTINNKVQLIGRLSTTPEVRILEGGRKMASMGLATCEAVKDARGFRAYDTQLHHLIAWGKLAAYAEGKLHKGAEIAIEGRLVYRQFTDKQGIKRMVTEIHVHDLMTMGKKQVATTSC